MLVIRLVVFRHAPIIGW